MPDNLTTALRYQVENVAESLGEGFGKKLKGLLTDDLGYPIEDELLVQKLVEFRKGLNAYKSKFNFTKRLPPDQAKQLNVLNDLIKETDTVFSRYAKLSPRNAKWDTARKFADGAYAANAKAVKLRNAFGNWMWEQKKHSPVTYLIAKSLGLTPGQAVTGVALAAGSGGLLEATAFARRLQHPAFRRYYMEAAKHMAKEDYPAVFKILEKLAEAESSEATATPGA
jgi:hypothetical protein